MLSQHLEVFLKSPKPQIHVSAVIIYSISTTFELWKKDASGMQKKHSVTIALYFHHLYIGLCLSCSLMSNVRHVLLLHKILTV